MNGISGFSFLGRDEFFLATGLADTTSVDGEPSGVSEDLTIGAEDVCDVRVLDGGGSFGDFEDGRGVKDGDKALRDEVEDFLSGLIEFDKSTGRDDGVVIADLFVIKDLFGFDDELLAGDVLSVLTERGGFARDFVHGLVDGADVVFWEVLGVSTRVGEHLVSLVERLSDLESLLGRESESG